MTSRTGAAVVVRRADPPEYAQIGRLTVAAYRADRMIPDGSRYDEQLADAAARADGAELLAAVIDGRVVGGVTFCRYGSPFAEISRPGEAEFRMLAVDPSARGSGVGEALVRAVLGRARDSGAEAVVLSTPDTALAAHRLYLRLGFVRLPERDWEPVAGVRLSAYRLPLADC